LRRALWLIAMVSLGCGGSDNNTSPPTNGNGPDGGAGLPSTVPPCLLSLPCQPTGACTSQLLDPTNPYVSNTCYATGVKSCMATDPATGSYITTTYKADGTLCYKMVMAFSATGITTTYTDPAGVQFGTATSSMTSTVMNVTCASDGKTYAFDYTATGSAPCTTGTCTCP
jgi:hypothetical protein